MQAYAKKAVTTKSQQKMQRCPEVHRSHSRFVATWSSRLADTRHQRNYQKLDLWNVISIYLKVSEMHASPFNKVFQYNIELALSNQRGSWYMVVPQFMTWVVNEEYNTFWVCQYKNVVLPV